VRNGWLSGMAHITGGGITGNLPRVLARNTQALVELGSWPVPKIFSYLARLGRIDQAELLRTFNMGAGMILIVPAKFVAKVEGELKRRREKFYRIGHIQPGRPRVVYGGALSL
jgi:phosphoribosylformylglycinamidine cyclo-ligase